MKKLPLIILALAACTPRQSSEKGGAVSFDPGKVQVSDIILSNPDSVLGDAITAYNDKDYPRAASSYLAYIEHNNTDAISLYNLACCFGLMGDSVRAASFLWAAWDAGFQDLEKINSDPDFDPVRGSVTFQNALDEMAEQSHEKSWGKQVTYFKAGAMLPCYVVLPDDYDAEERYPLVIGLHGYGSNYKRFADLFKRGYKTDPEKEPPKVDFIYAAPCAPYPMSGGSEPGYSWVPGDENLWQESGEMDMKYITSLPQELAKSWNVDTTKVYLLGFSQGAFMTYTIGLNTPKRFAGLIVFGGWLDSSAVSDEALAKAKGLRVFIAHGKSDQSVPLEAGQDAYKRLKDAGFDVQLNQFEGGHEVPMETLQFAIEWLGI